MIVIVAMILAILTFAFIGYPLLKGRSRPVELTADQKLRELRFRQDATYSMLKELEFDFQLGLLSEDDYRNLEARYKKKAISILREIDNLDKHSDVDKDVERKVSELRQTKVWFCPRCGAGSQEGDKFCRKCGTDLTQRERNN